jgi:hypothetical protein
MTSTTGAIPVLCDGSVVAANVFAFTLEIIRMAGSAEGCVLRPGIRNRSADRTTVAGSTAWVPSVVSRIFPLRVMTEAGRRPGPGGMTQVALCGGQ